MGSDAEILSLEESKRASEERMQRAQETKDVRQLIPPRGSLSAWVDKGDPNITLNDNDGKTRATLG